MTDPIRWTLSPTDSRVVALLRYFPVAFLGGHLGFAALVATLVVPALLDNPALLALLGLLVLVGGPASLLSLWPTSANAPWTAGWLTTVTATAVNVAVPKTLAVRYRQPDATVQGTREGEYKTCGQRQTSVRLPESAAALLPGSHRPAVRHGRL